LTARTRRLKSRLLSSVRFVNLVSSMSWEILGTVMAVMWLYTVLAKIKPGSTVVAIQAR